MKHIITTLLVVSYLMNPCAGLAQTQGSDYEAWLTTFLTRMNDLPLMPGTTDWSDLNTLLALKPAQETGPYYPLWFRNCFLPFIKDIGPFLDHEKAERLRYILAARPDKTDTSAFFAEYFQELLAFIGTMLPILDESEKVLLAAFKEVAPESSTGDFAAWLSAMDKLKEDFGPDYSDAENLLLSVLADFQPSNRPASSARISVPVETLMKMKQLISTGNPHLAVQEIDNLLTGK